jgi:two-component system sensor histidine kinase TctE
VERRSPRDLSAIDPQTTPAEVQPLVSALNRLFGLVNDQAEGQRRFVADAAHQLRTPLAGLQAQVEAWAQAAKVAQAAGSDGAVTLPADKIIKLRNATRRTSQLANQLLALSRADASAAAAQPMQRVDLKDLCESILPLHLDAATRKGIDLGLEAQPAQASGYEWLLRELLGNLVDNAVKYTPAGGTVTIRCGPGAPPDDNLDPGRQRTRACSWRSRTTARASRRMSAPRPCSAFTGCRARRARATAWAWPLPVKLPASTIPSWRWLTPAPRPRARVDCGSA